MNEQYIDERVNPSESAEEIDERMNRPVVNSDPFADKVPVDVALIHETPMGGTVASVGPLNEPHVNEIPVVDLDKEILVAEPNVYQASVQVEPIPNNIPVVEPVPYRAPMLETKTPAVPSGTNGGALATLLNREESEHFRARWNEIQGKFVDEPRTAVQQADTLVTEVIAQVSQMFANNHSSLESQWNQGNDVSTEDLRKALQSYRSFFNRLVV